MTQEFSLDQKKVTILAALVLVLVSLVFIAGYLSGTIVGLPEAEEQSVVLAPAKSPPKPWVVTMQVPRVEETPEFEEVAEVAEPESEEAEEIAVPGPGKEAPAEKLYSVQVGAFRTQARAEEHKQLLVAKGYQPYIYPGENSKGALWYTLRIGDFDQVDEAIAAAHEFRMLEGSYVVLTHFDSLMMLRDDAGKRIEITPPENTKPVAEADDDVAKVEEDEASIDGETAEANQYAVQVGAFLNSENAYAFAEKLKGRGYPAYIFYYADTQGNAWNAVRAGDFPDPETAKNAAIEFEGKENITAIVTRIDAISMVYVK